VQLIEHGFIKSMQRRTSERHPGSRRRGRDPDSRTWRPPRPKSPSR
jgi:hypothetical protein